MLERVIQMNTKKKKIKKQLLSPESKARALRVAYNLKRLRESRGIAKVNDLIDLMAKAMIEINPSYMRRLESANAPFGSDMEQRFIQFYKVDVSEFYRPIALTEKEKDIEAIRATLMGLDVQKVKRMKELIPVLFGGVDVEEGREEHLNIPDEKKSA